MQNNSFIDFKRERDIGTILSDTFKFIRENWKNYFSTVLKISAPAIIIFLVALGFYLYSFSGLFPNFGTLQTNVNPEPEVENLGIMAIAGIVFFLAAIASYVFINISSLYFIKSYIDNNGKVDFEEVKKNVNQNFWSFVGLGFLVGIILFFSAMLCFFPVIYTGVVLSLAFPIMVFEGKSVTDTISHCFTLIKDNWFSTFGVMFVVGFLVYILSMIFSIPALIYQMVQMFTSVGQEDPTAVLSLFKDPIYLLLNMLSYLGRFILSSITLISSVLIYYDLNEQKNLTGTIEKIDRLGQ